MAINFPDSPTIGDEFTGGGFTWTWNGSSWEKLATATTTSNGFSLLVGSTGNTTYAFEANQPAGAYSLTSQLGDTTFDIYLISENNTNVGYTNTTALEATEEFNKIVVYGATSNDILNFDYKPSSSPTSSGNVADGAAPFLSSASPTSLESIDDTTVVTGGNFATDIEIVFTGQDAVDRTAKNVVRSSSTSLIVTRPDDFPIQHEPYTMVATNAGISNPSTNAHKLIDYFDAGGGITWITDSTLPNQIVGAPTNITLQATDEDGTTISYSLTSGSLPAGLSFNGATGVISGTPTATASVTIEVTATDAGNNALSKEFYLNVVSETELTYLVVAGGGGGGGPNGGGGGAGGYRSSAVNEVSGGGASSEAPFEISVGASYTVTVGGGGAGGTPTASAGNPSTFSTISSTGGGRGADGSNKLGGNGGSGGGGTGYGSASNQAGGAGTANQGFNGGTGYGIPNGLYQGGAGGGGAAAAGQNASYATGGAGGAGVESSITGTPLFRAGGGGGAAYSSGASGGSGVGGNAGQSPTAGAQNTGSGGGAGWSQTSVDGMPGGSGVVILKYANARSISIGPGLVATTDSSSVPGYKITTFTQGTGNITFS